MNSLPRDWKKKEPNRNAIDEEFNELGERCNGQQA